MWDGDVGCGMWDGEWGMDGLTRGLFVHVVRLLRWRSKVKGE
jgi:hypothetical protein